MSIVIQGLANGAAFGPDSVIPIPVPWKTGEWVHFAPWVKHQDLKPGDLVVALTVKLSGYAIGFIENVGTEGNCVIREIGSERLIEINQDIFIPIKGLSETDLLDGKKRVFFEKLMFAFAYGGETEYLFDRLEFKDDTAIVWIKQPQSSQIHQKTKPFSIRMPMIFDPYAIRHYLNLGGYGTKQFEKESTDV